MTTWQKDERIYYEQVESRISLSANMICAAALLHLDLG
jgi:hypothetical protein